MAAFGALYPCFAPFAKPETADAMPEYKKGVVLGELVSANMTVTNASGEIWGDNKKVESISEFASAAIPMETVDLLDDAAEVIYGVTVVDGEVHYKPGDEAPYGGLVYIQSIQRGGVKFFKGLFYPKAQAAVGNINTQTKNTSITFQTTTTNFIVIAPLFDESAWMITSVFDKFEEAKAWANEKLSMS